MNKEKQKAVRVQTMVRVGEELVAALPYNTVNEVYYDVDKKIMLNTRLDTIDKDHESIDASLTTMGEKITTLEDKVVKIDETVGEGGNIAQDLTQASKDIEDMNNKKTDIINKNKVSEQIVNELPPIVNSHPPLLAGKEEGVHGIRFFNDEISYKDKIVNSWNVIQTPKADMDLIKHALGGNISTNQYHLSKDKCNIQGGCYKDGHYFINDPMISELGNI